MEKSYGIGIPMLSGSPIGILTREFISILKILLEDQKPFEFINNPDRKNRWLQPFGRGFKYFLQLWHY